MPLVALALMLTLQNPGWPQRIAMDSTYQAIDGSKVSARVEITGAAGTYRLATPGNPIGRFNEIQATRMASPDGTTAIAVTGRWTFKDQTGWFLFTAPRAGTVKGYWGSFERNGRGEARGEIRGDWDGTLTPQK